MGPMGPTSALGQEQTFIPPPRNVRSGSQPNISTTKAMQDQPGTMGVSTANATAKPEGISATK